MLINISEDIAQRLEQIAEQEGSSVSDLLKTLLNRYAPESPQGSLAELAQNARQAGLASAHPVNTADRSREILETEYAEYLRRRIEGSDADHNR